MFKTGKNIPTFTVSVILGRKVGYTDEIMSVEQIKNTIKAVTGKVDGFTFSGTITGTTIFASGSWGIYEEPAVIIGSSIYPRFPVEVEKFKNDFAQFVGYLATELKQERVAIQFSDESFMLETEYCKEPDIK